jgi:hypothetical protein
VVTGSAHLPCSIIPESESDGASLVLWYKDANPQPVYSFDARFTTVKHWSEDPTFGPRSRENEMQFGFRCVVIKRMIKILIN